MAMYREEQDRAHAEFTSQFSHCLSYRPRDCPAAWEGTSFADRVRRVPPPQLQEWLDDNCNDIAVDPELFMIGFNDLNDAVHFKLRWC
jgi:hypothetical protein